MSKLRESVVTLLYEIGNRSGCHQLPERSLFAGRHQFPVCARCTGVWIGQTAVLLLNPFCNISWKVSIIFLFIMGLDWSMQELKIRISTNYRRLFTGILGGFGLFNLYCIGWRLMIKALRNRS